MDEQDKKAIHDLLQEVHFGFMLADEALKKLELSPIVRNVMFSLGEKCGKTVNVLNEMVNRPEPTVAENAIVDGEVIEHNE